MQKIGLTFAASATRSLAAVDWATFCRTAAALPVLSHITVYVDDGTEVKAAYTQHAHGYLEALTRERDILLEISEWSKSPWN